MAHQHADNFREMVEGILFGSPLGQDGKEEKNKEETVMFITDTEQKRHEHNLTAMWLSPTYMAIDMLIGYSYACALIKNGWHDDCMFLIGILREKGRLA